MDKDLEQVSGGFQFDPELQPEPGITIPTTPFGTICENRNKGTEACILVTKGILIQCSGCSKNHD